MAVATDGLMVAGCSSSGSPQASQEGSTTGCPAIGGSTPIQTSKSVLAIVGVAEPGKVQPAFQAVERIAASGGGCFINYSFHDQTIDVYSYPPTTASQVATFARRMKSSGYFATVATQ